MGFKCVSVVFIFEFSYCRMYIFSVGYVVDMFSIVTVFPLFLCSVCAFGCRLRKGCLWFYFS
jgi:hypothetical protein